MLEHSTARCLPLVSPSFIHFGQKTAKDEQPTNPAASEVLAPSLRAITICPFSNSLRQVAFPLILKSRHKNDCLPSPAAVKFHSVLITWLKKCGGHNVLARM
ncbi:uncharacterized protein TNCV_4269861 [Trichonephila clavipes]|nr:uncharacterized protein TNCV_4269861 [Trichonephila clavipes]